MKLKFRNVFPPITKKDLERIAYNVIQYKLQDKMYVYETTENFYTIYPLDETYRNGFIFTLEDNEIIFEM